MFRNACVAIWVKSFVLAGCVAMLCCSNSVFAQSDIVFMTADKLPNLTSYLYRFDAGVQSFEVNSGGNPAYQGLTVTGGRVLVADYIGEAIQSFSPDGTYLGAFASVLDPAFLESDSSGNVYVASALSGSIARRYDSSGALSQSFSHPNLTSPRGIDADAFGNVYVANGNEVLFKFAANGTFIGSFPLGITNVNDISIDEAGGRMIVADEFSASGIKIFDISIPVPANIGSIVTPANSSIVGVHYAAESGNIFGVDIGFLDTARGFEYSPGGALLHTYLPTNAGVAFDIATYVVPEPASAALMLVAVGACGVGRRRR